MQAQPQREHDWLRQMVGEWKVESEENDWSESIRAVGDVWILAEGRGANPDGSQASSIMTLGFDPVKNRFVGTWIGSMMHNLWLYEGELDDAGRVLTLHSEGPRFDDSGETTSYRDIIELDEDGNRIFRAEVLERDGSWKEMMRTLFRRLA